MHIKISTISFLIVQTTAGFDPEPSIFIPKRPVGTMCFDIDFLSRCRHALQPKIFVHELRIVCAKFGFLSYLGPPNVRRHSFGMIPYGVSNVRRMIILDTKLPSLTNSRSDNLDELPSSLSASSENLKSFSN